MLNKFRSYGECALVILFKKNYPNLKIECNDREILLGYEADIVIYLPNGNPVIIEYNGVGHSVPIFGETSFERTVANDKFKKQIAKLKNIHLYIVKQAGDKTNHDTLVKEFISLTKKMKLNTPKMLSLDYKEVMKEKGRFTN